MRRPGATRAQRQHAREQRALLRLRRAAVRFSVITGAPDREDECTGALVDLEGACDNYTEVIGKRAARKLGGA